MKDKASMRCGKLFNLLLVIVVIFLTVVKAVSVWTAQPEEDKYRKYMAAGREYMAEGYYVEAMQEFLKADEINPSREARLSAAECYLMLGDMASFKQEAENIKTRYGDSERLYIDLVYYCMQMNDIAGEIKLLEEAVKKYPESEYLNICYDSVKGAYIVDGATYEMVYATGNGYDLAVAEDSYSVIADDIKKMGNIEFEEIYDVYLGDEWFVSGLKDGVIRYYDQNGYMRKTPEGDFIYLGLYRDGYALIQDESGWGYIDEEEQLVGEVYEEATAFSDGIAAVKKDGKWILVDEDFERVTEQIYDDVIRDEFCCCVFSGRIFAKRGAEYVMLDTAGNEVAVGYSEVRPFMEKDGYAAVCDKDGWKIIDTAGNIIECVDCDELNASGNGLMAYRIGDKWGYIGVGDGIYVEPVFAEALRVNSKGYAAVNTGDEWKYILFLKFEAVAM